MKKIIIALILCTLCVVSYAQKQWTLEECIRYAIDHNVNIKQIELQKENAEIDVNTAQMSRLPDLNAGIGHDWSFGRNRITSEIQENTTQTSTSFSIGTSVPLFTGFRITNQIAKNKLELEAAIQGLEKAKEDLSLNITSLFLQVLFNKEIVKVNTERLSLSKQQVDRTKTLVEVGKVPQSQLFDIEAQVAKDEVTLIESQNNLKLALLDLTQNLELQNESNFDIYAPEFNNVISEFMSSVQPINLIYDNALDTKPVIKEQEYKIKSAEKSFRIAQSGYYPTLDLNARYSTGYYYNYNLKDKVDLLGVPYNGSFGDQLKDQSKEYISLSLNIPIFSRFSVRNQVRSAKLNIHNQQLLLDNTKKTLYKEIQTAYLNATAAQEKYRAANKAVKATSESFKYAQERYEIGKSTVFEFDEAKNRLIQSQSEEIQAKYDYIFRTKILDFYNGIPIRL